MTRSSSFKFLYFFRSVPGSSILVEIASNLPFLDQIQRFFPPFGLEKVVKKPKLVLKHTVALPSCENPARGSQGVMCGNESQIGAMEECGIIAIKKGTCPSLTI